LRLIGWTLTVTRVANWWHRCDRTRRVVSTPTEQEDGVGEQLGTPLRHGIAPTENFELAHERRQRFERVGRSLPRCQAGGSRGFRPSLRCASAVNVHHWTSKRSCAAEEGAIIPRWR
jgi:hypothetical protein